MLALFFQCCFMIETQVLMTDSFFLGIISWKGASLFNGRFVFQLGGFIFKWGHPIEGISFDGGRGCRKNHRMGGFGGGSPCPPTMGNPEV